MKTGWTSCLALHRGTLHSYSQLGLLTTTPAPRPWSHTLQTGPHTQLHPEVALSSSHQWSTAEPVPWRRQSSALHVTPESLRPSPIPILRRPAGPPVTLMQWFLCSSGSHTPWKNWEKGWMLSPQNAYTHTHPYIYIHIYIYVCWGAYIYRHRIIPTIFACLHIL